MDPRYVAPNHRFTLVPQRRKPLRALHELW